MAAPSPSKSSYETDWTESLRGAYFRSRIALKRMWWIAVICLAAGIAFEWYLQSQKSPVYQSRSEMVIDGQVTIPEGARYQEVFLNFFGTQIKFMQSQQVRERAAQRVAALYPELNRVSVRVQVRQAEDASAFELIATGSEPEYTRRYLDAVMHEFLAYKAERRKETTEKTFLTIMEKVVEKQQEIEDLEEQKLGFQRANNIVFITEQGNNVGSYLADLNGDRAALRRNIRTLDSLKDDPSKSQTGSAALIEYQLAGLDPEYEVIKREVERLDAERAEFSIYMKPAHPKIKRLDQEIERQQNLLNIYRRQTLSQLDERKKRLQAELINLDDLIAEVEVEALKFSTLLAEFDRLNSRLDSAKGVHDRLLSSIDSLDISKNTHQETISILQPATKAKDVPLDSPKEIIFGGLKGLAVGLVFIRLLSAFDTRVVSAEDIGSRFTPPVLGVIPIQNKAEGKARVPILRPGDDRVMFAESCRNIRSSLLFMDINDKRPQVILMTSAVPSEGKSTISSNLSTTLAFAQSKTLIVDADLRRGRVHVDFGINNVPGLAELIEDPNLVLEDVVQGTENESLDVIPCGDYPERPGELLLSKRFEKLVAEMRERYDYIIFDCPPVLATDDTPSFATKADAVLFIVRSNYTRTGQIKSCEEILRLRGVEINGFILNFVDTRQPSHYYYYNRYNDYYNYRPAAGKDDKKPTAANLSA